MMDLRCCYSLIFHRRLIWWCMGCRCASCDKPRTIRLVLLSWCANISVNKYSLWNFVIFVWGSSGILVRSCLYHILTSSRGLSGIAVFTFMLQGQYSTSHAADRIWRYQFCPQDGFDLNKRRCVKRYIGFCGLWGHMHRICAPFVVRRRLDGWMDCQWGVALLHAGHKTGLMCTTVYLWCHNHLFFVFNLGSRTKQCLFCMYLV
jgi:hypothetical protein